MTIIEQTYERKCDECRASYEHVKGAPTGWCPECAKRMHAVADPGRGRPAITSSRPYVRVLERPGRD